LELQALLAVTFEVAVEAVVWVCGVYLGHCDVMMYEGDEKMVSVMRL
jgi:hypothetical protein